LDLLEDLLAESSWYFSKRMLSEVQRYLMYYELFKDYITSRFFSK
jgi:hypothetical protein